MPTQKVRVRDLERFLHRSGLPLYVLAGVAVSSLLLDNIQALAVEVFNGCVPEWAISVAFIVMSLLVFIWMFMRYNRESRAAAFEPLSHDLQQPEGKKGLILLVSNPEHALRAIKYHKDDKGALQHVWLIPSNDAQQHACGGGSGNTALEIQRRVKKDWGDAIKCDIVEGGVSPTNAHQTFNCVQEIFERKGIDPKDIIADITGGTKPMTTGMIMASLEHDRELQYIAYNPARKDDKQDGGMSGPFLLNYVHAAFGLVS
ncbi:MAG: hypothetical protein HYV27_08035 [Candidatus Hydrogenedentes bacterium]|nr:hypothetical protein [Candidatus Hydrogenedentota bacterium]